MAILPCSYVLDFSMLCQSLRRDLDPLYGIETHRFFEQYGCKTGCHPPLPGAFAIPALADASLVANEDAENLLRWRQRRCSGEYAGGRFP